MAQLISVEIERRQRAAIICKVGTGVLSVPPTGRSGSGKTTLTRLMSGMYPVQQGLLRIDGYDSRELDLTHLRRNLGLVLQDNFLFRGTVRENIACVKRDATFAEVVAAAQLAGADEFIERLPRGFDTMLEEDASNLSGGQKQRLAIARALIVNPRILILDEATSALDSESETIIRRNLRRIAAGRTVIIVSHRLVDADGREPDPGDRSWPDRRRGSSRPACCRNAPSTGISGISRQSRSHEQGKKTTRRRDRRLVPPKKVERRRRGLFRPRAAAARNHGIPVRRDRDRAAELRRASLA